MDTEKTYVLAYNHLQTCSRLNMVANGKVASYEVFVVDPADVNNPNAKTTRAVASLMPNGEDIQIEIPDGGGEFVVDVPGLRHCIGKHHPDKFRPN